MSRLITCLILTLCISCSYKYESVTRNGYEKGDLVHTVILKLKENTSNLRTEEIISELQSLSSIKQTKCLLVATQAETADLRAKTDFNLILQVAFESIKDLETYSTDQHHLAVRSHIKNDLAQAPVVYDYWVE